VTQGNYNPRLLYRSTWAIPQSVLGTKDGSSPGRKVSWKDAGEDRAILLVPRVNPRTHQ